MHWVDIALGLPAVPEQTDSQSWLRGSLASRKHDIISQVLLIWTHRQPGGVWGGQTDGQTEPGEPNLDTQEQEGIPVGRMDRSVKGVPTCTVWIITWRMSEEDKQADSGAHTSQWTYQTERDTIYSDIEV